MRKQALIVLAAALCSCAGPRPIVPAGSGVSPPTKWAHTSDGPPPADVRTWVEQFGDPVLTALVVQALSDNVDVALAAAHVAQARAQLGIADAQRQVNVGGELAGARERDLNPGFGIPEEQTAGEAALTASYELDLFGRLAASTDAARATLVASEDSREAVRLAVASSVVSGYIALAGLTARRDVLTDTLAARANELHFAKRRADSGYAPVIDLRQAEAALQSTQQQIPATALAIARQEGALGVLLGRNPGPIEKGSGLRALTIPPTPVVIPSQLLRQRPDLRAAEQQIVASEHSLDAARAAFMPKISLTASGGYVDSTLIEDPARIFSIGGSILAPILDGGRLRAQQSLAAARRDEAAYAYRKAALTAFKEVEDSLEATVREEEAERSIDRQRAALDSVYTLAKNRYRSGYSSYLEQLDAQRALLSAELALVQARVDRLGTAVSLYQSLGGAALNAP